MTSAVIVYASLTGNTKTCMHIIKDKLIESGVEVEDVEVGVVSPDIFLKADICLVGSYTYGEDGDLPDEMVDFYEELADENLKGKIFGVFGSGDTYYKKYCQAVTDFEEQFLKTGATKGSESVKVELMPDMDDLSRLHAFCDQLLWWGKRLEEQNR